MNTRENLIRAILKRKRRKNAKKKSTVDRSQFAELDLEAPLPVTQREIDEEVTEMIRYNADSRLNTAEL